MKSLRAFSHLPHVVAAAVVNIVCNYGAHPLNFVGPGFKDFTRIASGPFEMWTEICLENRVEIGRALDHLIEELGKVRATLENSMPSSCARCSSARNIIGMN